VWRSTGSTRASASSPACASPTNSSASLQRNLLLSHATGVGEPLPQEQSRLAFALRIHNLALGFSGVRIETLEQAMALWNGGYLPVIPAQGSVGASGDLAPLSHMALPLIGCGEVHAGDEVITGAEALRRLGREPLELGCKEGLALVNGTQIMTAIGCSRPASRDAARKAADIAVR
jgi:histidine ammonia-lyase